MEGGEIFLEISERRGKVFVKTCCLFMSDRYLISGMGLLWQGIQG